MIRIQKIILKNFMSVGNKPLEVNLDHDGITLICGDNGVGKSTLFLYSIYYSLYGKSFSKTKLSSLVNNINNKDMLVEIYFTINKHEYIIKRGIKPNIFEIHIDGKLKTQTAHNKDYQQFLEKEILHMDEKTFRQLVVIGSTSYIPFMRLSPWERRIVVEDILDIGIFSKMSEYSKLEMNDINNNLSSLQEELHKLEQNKAILDAKKNQYMETSEEYKKSLEKELFTMEKTINDLEEDYKAIEETPDDIFINMKNKKEKLTKVVKEAEKIQVSLETKIKNLEKTKKFFDENNTCPTCKMTIPQEVKESNISIISTKIVDMNDKINQCNDKIEELYSKIDKTKEEIEKINETNRKRSNILDNIKQNLKQKQNIQDKINHINQDSKEKQENTNGEIKEIESKIQKKETHIDQVKNDIKSLVYLQNLLKDDGIKANIISMYLPKLNQLIQKYIDICGFNIVFSFNNTFDAFICDRLQENREYMSMSEGERSRIDLAITMSLRDLARLRSSISLNIIVIDEDDSTLDRNGQIAFMEILNSIENTNIMIISHHWEEYQSYAKNNYIIRKEHGFTKIEEI